MIIAASLADDFIETSDMDTFKSQTNPEFSANLLAKSGLLKAEIIAKTILSTNRTTTIIYRDNYDVCPVNYAVNILLGPLEGRR